MPKAIDMTGVKSGKLTALEPSNKKSGKSLTWICECECGNKVTVGQGNLRSGNVKSCGCLQKARDLTGLKFGRWTVVRHDGVNSSGGHMWICQCECGKQSSCLGYSLVHELSKSCGCYSADATTSRLTKHGRWGTPEYRCWHMMRQRCQNPKAKGYKYYGGRGIKVCDRWKKFDNFFADMGEKPTPDHSIERMDFNGDYEPDNCKWATDIEQNNNTRRNIKNRTK